MLASARPTRQFLLATLPVALSLLLASCVTERSPSSTPGSSASRYSNPSSASSARQNPGAPVSLPAGPLAHPAEGRTQSAQVRTAMMDLGSVSFDGLVLPIVSPDGRFIAVQDGVAPTWPTLLAAPGAEVAQGTRVVAYSLPVPSSSSANTQSPSATPLAWGRPLPTVLLGHSADNTGFLVEAPQPDGSRWIGRVSWISGALNWIVQGRSVNAYAVLGPDGELAYCRRAIDSDSSVELVVRSSLDDSREFVAAPPGGAYLFPLFSDEPGVVYAFSLVAGAAELHALKIPRKGDPPALVVVGRQPLLRDASAMMIYQMTASLQVPLPTRLTSHAAADTDKQESGEFDKLFFFNAAQGRICVYDRRVGTVVPLLAGSFAAAPVIGNESDPGAAHSGYVLTTQSSLEYVAGSDRNEFDRLRGVPESGEGVSVMKGAFVPRLTSDPRWSMLLVGPDPGASGVKIHLFRLRLGGVDGNAEGRP